jgi:transketolase
MPAFARRFRRPLHPLRHPRARHGRGDERHGAAWRHHPLFGGTFLVFTDYCRPAIRLAALMGQRVIHVMTHDSIGLGEDGPTHQPVEHLAALRAIPNLLVFRPATRSRRRMLAARARARDGPSVLALTRQNLPALRTEPARTSARAAATCSPSRPAAREVTI